MLVKITTLIFVEVEDQDQAEAAASTIERGLEGRMRPFPEGEVVSVDVEGAEPVSDEEANERGLVE
jgi:hypothetical protein